MKCKWCGSTNTVMAGQNPSGSQRHFCKKCRRHFTPLGKRIGYDDTVKVSALRHYIDGNNYRRTGRQLGINHQTVANWVKAAADKAAAQPAPRPEVNNSTVVELDELFTFVGTKKRDLRRHASPSGNAVFHKFFGGHSAHRSRSTADH